MAAALKAGSDGVILSRKYSEMRLENLSAAGALSAISPIDRMATRRSLIQDRHNTAPQAGQS